jgi:hypothetical protein
MTLNIKLSLQAIKVHRGIGGVAPLTINLSTRWKRVINLLPASLTLLHECVYFAVRSAHTVYLCVLCGSENKQQLFH